MLSNCGQSSKISFRMASLVRTIVCLALICISLFAHTTDGQKYSSKYDEIDIDGILENPRLRNQYVGCIIRGTPCVTAAARFLKENFAEAFVTKCNKCTEKQVTFFDKIVEWFTTNEPDTWNRAVEIALEKVRNKNK